MYPCCFSSTIGPIRPPPLLPHLLRCLLSSTTQPPPPASNFMTEYLISTCGFSPDKAIEAAKRLTGIKSPAQPDAVLSFFRARGFDDTQIKKLISCHPQWLRSSVGKNLKPKFQELQEMGFSPADLTHIILSTPDVLNHSFHRTVVPKIALWRELLGSTDLLMKFLKRKPWLLKGSMEGTILPNLAVLRECNVPDSRIAMMLRHHPAFILQSPSRLKAHIEVVEGLGVSRESQMFLWALHAMDMVSADKFKAKLELMMEFGWSELDFLAAFRRAPVFLSVSMETIKKKMEFLVKEVGCEPAYLAMKPTLIMYSLEKRLIPRYRVLEVLKSRGLRGGKYKFLTVMATPEKKFIEDFIHFYKKEVPELHELYLNGMQMASCNCEGSST